MPDERNQNEERLETLGVAIRQQVAKSSPLTETEKERVREVALQRLQERQARLDRGPSQERGPELGQ